VAAPLRYDAPFPARNTINPATDTDFFTFEGVASTQVRIVLSSATPGLDPRSRSGSR
jgi:hypothetical protein